MKKLIIATLVLFAFAAQADTKSDSKSKEGTNLICVSDEDLDKMLVEKGYDILLTMKNEDDIVESIWTAGQSIIITAKVPNEKKDCFLDTMKDVTFNPKAIEEIWETYKKQTKQRDI